MNSSEYTRIKRSVLLHTGVGITQSHVVDDVLPESRFGSQQIRFNGQIVKDTCCPGSGPRSEPNGAKKPKRAAIKVGYTGRVPLKGIMNANYIRFKSLSANDNGTVNFGNGVSIPISRIKLNTVYPTGLYVSIYSSKLSKISVEAVGGTDITAGTPLPLLKSMEIVNTYISSIDMSKYSALNVFNCSGNYTITSISGLGSCPRLTDFSCADCSIAGNLDISRLTNLRTLNCSGNPITQLVGLEGCVKMTQLSCNDCSISGSLDVSTLTNLKKISYSGNPLTEIVGLSNCTSLANLTMASGTISGVFDISSFTNLTTFTCSGNSISELAGLSACTLLTTLTCADCQISGTFDLSGLNNLTTLTCSGNPITAFAGLSTCTLLTNLTCNNCQISGALDLSGLTHLTTLLCSDNSIEELKGISTCIALTSLTCNNSGINQPLDISGLTHLSILSLVNCRIPEFIGLSTCTALTSIAVFGNNDTVGIINVPDFTQLTTLILGNIPNFVITGLSDSTSLINLTLEYCTVDGVLDVSKLTHLTILSCTLIPTITGFSGLSNCTSLTEFSCHACSVSGILDVSGLTQLTTLACNYNPITEIVGLHTCSILNNCQAIYCNITNEDPSYIATGIVKDILAANPLPYGNLQIYTQSFGQVTGADDLASWLSLKNDYNWTIG